MTGKRIPILLLGIFLLLSFSACNDEDDPVCPGDTAPTPSLANVWPHTDGTTWFYDIAYQEFYLPFPDQAQADKSGTEDLPDMATLHADLQNPPAGTPSISETCILRLALAGEVTTDSGVTAQNMESSLYFPESSKRNGSPLFVQNAPDNMLQIIAEARPDLAESLEPFIDPAAKTIARINPPIFLDGYAFSAEDDGIFGYGDVDAEHSWIYLPADLEVGTEFSIQLLPSISDDLFLYGSIWSIGDLVKDGISYRNVLECMYAIDLGMVNIVDEEGNLIGEFHSYMYGSIHYAPGFGPIKSLERRYLGPSSLNGSDNPYMIDFVID